MNNVKEKAIEELIKIIDITNFNIFIHRQLIMRYANENNMFNLVNYVGNDNEAYLELLKIIDKTS